MTLHHDLLDQAEHLAKRETKKPKQASLRRAVSAAYYALFHFLITDAAKRLCPTNPPGLRLIVQRAFEHGEMRNVCQGFLEWQTALIKGRQPGRLPPTTRALITPPLEPALLAVMQAFVDLQEARNQADYDFGKPLNRLDVLNGVQTARQAFGDWTTIRGSTNANVFLSALLLQRHWSRR